MKRLLVTLFVAVLLGGIAYTLSYYVAQDTFCRPPDTGDKLGWLRQEFHLTDSQYAQVKQLHSNYYPQCTMMCDEIKQSHETLAKLISSNSSLTPEVEVALKKDNEVQQECQEAMLRHFYAVSQVMPPDEGKRYLQMMETKVIRQDRIIIDSPESQH